MKTFSLRIMQGMYAIIIIVLFTIGLTFWRGCSPRRTKESAMAAPPEHQANGTNATSGLSGSESENARLWKKTANISFPMSRRELDRARVALPEAVNKPWKGSFYHSTTCFESDEIKLAAVDVLPLWIRKMLVADEADMAGRYLWTLIRFTEDENTQVKMKAVFSLYRLGDSHSIADKQMRRWLEEGTNLLFGDSDYGQIEDIRTKVLQDLNFYHDVSFDDMIYKLWSNRRNNEGQEVAAVDYAYYLEKHRRELPVDYWIQRLGSPYGFANALEIAEKRGTPELAAKLQPLFEESRGKLGGHNANPGKTAAIASALFRMTGDVQYRD